ncbi:hypothetical protein [Halobacillus sp. Marseille-Q1614]|uniref:hypothetical protein n=1 Tax=Halobacillus sp. Marseille-Q1614 TaxID=2709134 RepID=UPI00156DCB25|nr:hypothetical protein [Halobacillus sp. Marseille-Q1614]
MSNEMHYCSEVMLKKIQHNLDFKVNNVRDLTHYLVIEGFKEEDIDRCLFELGQKEVISFAENSNTTGK